MHFLKIAFSCLLYISTASPTHYIWMQSATYWVIANMTFFILLLLTHFYSRYLISVIVIDLWSGTDGDCVSLAVTQSHIWALDRQTFQTIMMRSTQARHEEYFSFLRRYIHVTNICACLSVISFTPTHMNTQVSSWLFQCTFLSESIGLDWGGFSIVFFNGYCGSVTNVYQCSINWCRDSTVKIISVGSRVECVDLWTPVNMFMDLFACCFPLMLIKHCYTVL